MRSQNAEIGPKLPGSFLNTQYYCNTCTYTPIIILFLEQLPNAFLYIIINMHIIGLMSVLKLTCVLYYLYMYICQNLSFLLHILHIHEIMRSYIKIANRTHSLRGHKIMCYCRAVSIQWTGLLDCVCTCALCNHVA